MTQLVDLQADVLPHLNMLITPPAAVLTELQGFITDAVPVIEDIVGHIVAQTYDETYDGGNSVIYLRQLPVLSITSVSEYIGLTGYTLSLQPVGFTVDNYGYSLGNSNIGDLTRRDGGGQVSSFYANADNIEVVYVAGRTSVPGNIRMGTLELIRHWYQSSQQAAGKGTSYAPGSSDTDGTDGYSPTPAGYLVPNRVKEALQPSLRPLVIA